MEKEIVNEILEDLTLRGGLENAWEQIDSDTQGEIKESWERRIRTVLANNGVGVERFVEKFLEG